MKKIGLGVIGAGDRSIGYLKGTFTKLQEEGIASVVGVADTNSVRAAEGQKDLNAAACFTDYQKLLAMDELDAVFIMTPDYPHAPIVLDTLAAGKHIYCEKPMATTIEDCNAIVKAAKNAPGLFFAGHNVRFGPTGPVVNKMIKEGRLGAVRMVWARRFVQGAKYWHRWHRDKQKSGGLLVHKGCHYLDQMNWHSLSRPRYVAAFGGLDVYKTRPNAPKRCLECKEHCAHFMDLTTNERHGRYFLNAEREDGYIRDLCVFAPGATVFDNATVNVQYANGIRGTYMECHFAAISDRETEVGVVGDDGLVLVSRSWDGELQIRFEDAKTHKAELVSPDTSKPMGDERAVRAFVTCVQNNSKPESGYEAGWDSAALGITAQKAAAEMKIYEIIAEDGIVRAI